jgi:hypothetical protein
MASMAAAEVNCIIITGLKKSSIVRAITKMLVFEVNLLARNLNITVRERSWQVDRYMPYQGTVGAEANNLLRVEPMRKWL